MFFMKADASVFHRMCELLWILHSEYEKSHQLVLFPQAVLQFVVFHYAAILLMKNYYG